MSPRRKIAVALLALIACVFPGCSGGGGRERERAVAELAARMEQMALVIGGVTDKDSAERAVMALRAVVEEMKAVALEAKASGEPPPEERVRLAAQLRAASENLERRMAALRVPMQKAGPHAVMILFSGLKELTPAMNGITALYDPPAAP